MHNAFSEGSLSPGVILRIRFYQPAASPTVGLPTITAVMPVGSAETHRSMPPDLEGTRCTINAFTKARARHNATFVTAPVAGLTTGIIHSFGRLRTKTKVPNPFMVQILSLKPPNANGEIEVIISDGLIAMKAMLNKGLANWTSNPNFQPLSIIQVHDAAISDATSTVYHAFGVYVPSQGGDYTNMEIVNRVHRWLQLRCVGAKHLQRVHLKDFPLRTDTIKELLSLAVKYHTGICIGCSASFLCTSLGGSSIYEYCVLVLLY